MKFKDSHKAVFLPVCEKVLCQYKGFVMNEEMLPDLSEKDVYDIRKEFTNEEPEGGIRIFVVLLFLFSQPNIFTMILKSLCLDSTLQY